MHRVQMRRTCRVELPYTPLLTAHVKVSRKSCHDQWHKENMLKEEGYKGPHLMSTWKIETLEEVFLHPVQHAHWVKLPTRLERH